MRLRGQGIWSQHGEDAMILDLLADMETMPHVCCEVGAADGLELSNTAALWRDRAWRGVLVEAKESHRDALEENTAGYDVAVHVAEATPQNINQLVPADCSVLSIDVDGDDYLLFEASKAMPLILVIEYNPTIPYWLHVVGEQGGQYGASVTAIVELARSRGLHLAGATPCNLIFCADADVAARYDTDLEAIIGRSDLTYLTTTYLGRMRPIGPLCFGLVFDE